MNKKCKIKYQNLYNNSKMHKFRNNKEKKMQLNFQLIKFQKKNIRENMEFHQEWQELQAWDRDLRHQGSHQKQQLLQLELKKLCFQVKSKVFSLHQLNKMQVEIFKNHLFKIITFNKKKSKNKDKQ